jgi:hypothetical protein
MSQRTYQNLDFLAGGRNDVVGTPRVPTGCIAEGRWGTTIFSMHGTSGPVPWFLVHRREIAAHGIIWRRRDTRVLREARPCRGGDRISQSGSFMWGINNSRRGVMIARMVMSWGVNDRWGWPITT